MLQRLLFLWTVGIALALALLVVVAPGLVRQQPGPPAWLLLFAHDATVRKATIACALGLIMTAALFFRTPRRPRSPDYERSRRPANTIGA